MADFQPYMCACVTDFAIRRKLFQWPFKSIYRRFCKANHKDFIGLATKQCYIACYLCDCYRKVSR